MNFIDIILKSDHRLALTMVVHPGMVATGKKVKDVVTSGRIHYEVIKYLSDNFNLLANTTFMDSTIEAEAFGISVKIPENDRPYVTSQLAANRKAILSMQIPDMTAGRLPQFLFANRLAAENINDKPLLSGCIGPFSLAEKMLGDSEIKTIMHNDPEAVVRLLSNCTKFLIRYCKNLKNTGASGVIINESPTMLVSDEDYRTLSSAFIKQISETIQDNSFAVILQNTQNPDHCIDAMLSSGANALLLGSKINITNVLKKCPSNIVIIGNLDPLTTFKHGTESDIRTKTTTLLEQTINYKNFVIGGSDEIPADTSRKNIMAFYGAVRAFNDRNRN